MRFHIALHLARYARESTTCIVFKAEAILQNMVTESGRGEYASRERREIAAAMRGGGAEGTSGRACNGGAAGMLPRNAGPVHAIHRAEARNAFIRAMRSWKKVRTFRKHEALRKNLAELVYLEGCDVLDPYQ